MQASEGKELTGNVYLNNRRQKKRHRKQVHGLSGWLRLTYGDQTARMGPREE